MSHILRLFRLTAPALLSFAEPAQALTWVEEPVEMTRGRALEAEGKLREAVQVYRLAARKGSCPAAKRLAEIHDRGRPGVNAALAESESVQWHEIVRRCGDMAQGRALEAEGKFLDAVREYARAARYGSGPAAKRLGEIYEKGAPGIARDFAEALQWYEVARQAGEAVPPGPMDEGRQLEAEGKFRDAVRVYRLAARKGSGPAATRLAEIYDRGVPGVPRDLGEALQWCKAARVQGETELPPPCHHLPKSGRP
jgi:TPR repeat protein